MVIPGSVVLACAVLFACAAAYLYGHLRVLYGTSQSQGGQIRFPGVVIAPYFDTGLLPAVPKKVAAQCDEFVNGVNDCRMELQQSYGDSLTLDYAMSKGDRGLVVRFFGNAADENGKTVSIDKTLEFSFFPDWNAKLDVPCEG